MFEEHRGFWIVFRQALLLMVDAVEKGMKMSPTTAEIRAMHKDSTSHKQ